MVAVNVILLSCKASNLVLVLKSLIILVVIKTKDMSKFHKSGNKGKFKYNKENLKVGAQGKEALEKIDEASFVFQCFKKYSQELDKKHDKFERILKLSRDITIESKRIIFLLHSIDRDSKKSLVLNEAESRLETLVSHQWKSIASELHKEDPFLYHRAFSPGLQEFMEAYIFFNYLKYEKFPHWDKFQKKLKYFTLEDSSEKLLSEGSKSEKNTSVILVPVDFILGLADVTGELMRKCINNLGEGDVEGCFKTCNFVRSLYSGFLTVGLFGNKEMSHKLYTLKKSLLKMELVCYNIHVRGSEIPKYMLADVDSHATYTEEDEGFFG